MGKEQGDTLVAASRFPPPWRVAKIEAEYPNLKNSGWKLQSRAQQTISAWAACDTTRRWWPGPAPVPPPSTYWPKNICDDETVDCFIKVFAALGYRVCENDRYELGYQKVGDPTDPAYKGGTQHGANRLAAIGLAVLTLVPETHGKRARPAVIGGSFGSSGFSFSWPIWNEPATLAAIRALLGHPGLRNPSDLVYLGVDHVRTAKRISVGKFMNFTRARISD